MQVNSYRPYVGRPYQKPHGCFELVTVVYQDLYGINLDGMDNGIEPGDVQAQMTRLHSQLAQKFIEVDAPQEGDLVLVRSVPWHIGVALNSGEMLHCYGGGSACIEPFTAGRWRRRVEGFYRYPQ